MWIGKENDMVRERELKRKYGTAKRDSQRVDRNDVQMLHVRSSSKVKTRVYITREYDARMQSEFYLNSKHDIAAIYTWHMHIC